MLASLTKVAIEEAQALIALESELLDEWRLDDWLKLYTDDMIYLVPTPGMPMDCSPETSLFLINDDRFRMESRVEAAEEADRAFRISALDHRAHVRPTCASPGRTADGTQVNGVFHVSRYRDGIIDIFLGRVRYRLVKQGEDVLHPLQALRSRSRRARPAGPPDHHSLTRCSVCDSSRASGGPTWTSTSERRSKSGTIRPAAPSRCRAACSPIRRSSSWSTRRSSSDAGSIAATTSNCRSRARF